MQAQGGSVSTDLITSPQHSFIIKFCECHALVFAAEGWGGLQGIVRLGWLQGGGGHELASAVAANTTADLTSCSNW